MADLLDLDAIEAAAKAATPGRWRWVALDTTVGDDPMHLHAELQAPRTTILSAEEVRAVDAEFIALANPATVLRLVERVRELEKLRDAVIRDDADALCAILGHTDDPHYCARCGARDGAPHRAKEDA